MTVKNWVLEEEQEMKENHPDFTNWQIFENLVSGVLASFQFEIRRIGELHWNERIDDKENARLVAEVRKNRNDDLAAVMTWFDWVKDGRPE